MGRRPKPKPHQSPGWSLKGQSHAANPPTEPCRWDKFLEEEKIEEKDIGTDAKVWRFVKHNYDKFYIPTKVLKMWNMDYEG